MTLQSVSLFVGSSRCNGNCSHCAGRVHRKFAPLEDGVVDEKLIRETLESCYDRGARSLSVSSSGEPTLSPLSLSIVFDIVGDLENGGRKFEKINLYSNGIIIGEDEGFCEKYLPLWRSKGLKTIYITVHSVDEMKNAEIYGVKQYPSLKLILDRIHKFGLKARANVVLSKSNVGDLGGFISFIEALENLGFDKISAWSIRDENDRVDLELAPDEVELDLMERWILETGRGVVLHREKDQLLYKESKKLTLFPDGTLSNTWCN